MRVLAHPAFAAGDTDTHFIAKHGADLMGQPADTAAVAAAAIATTLVDHLERSAARTVLPGMRTGFRNSRFGDEWTEYEHGDDTIRVAYRDQGKGRLRFEVDGAEELIRNPRVEDGGVSYENGGGVRRSYRVIRDGVRRFVASPAGSFGFREVPRFPDPDAAGAAGGCTAPMPGKVVKVLVAEGDPVEAGQTVVILEAMKMEHPVKASEAGVVASISAVEGEQVDADETLVVVEAAE
jgi:propionyl-CoA carboxylase alpha chain